MYGLVASFLKIIYYVFMFIIIFIMNIYNIYIIHSDGRKVNPARVILGNIRLNIMTIKMMVLTKL
jgi:hypothetical protein